MSEYGTKKKPLKLRFSMGPSPEALKQQDLTQTPPTQSQSSDTSVHDQLTKTPATNRITIKAGSVLKTLPKQHKLKQTLPTQSPSSDTSVLDQPTKNPAKYRIKKRKFEAGEQQKSSPRIRLRLKLSEETSQSNTMSRPPTPCSMSFAGNSYDHMLEFSLIKELVLNSGAIVHHNFVDHRLVFKVRDPGADTIKYEAVLMGRCRNDTYTIDAFTVLERSVSESLDRQHALEELLEIMEAKLLALPGF